MQNDTKKKPKIDLRLTSRISFIRELVAHAVKLSTVGTLNSPVSVQLTSMQLDGWSKGSPDEDEPSVKGGLWQDWETAEFLDEDIVEGTEVETFLAHVSGYYSLYTPADMSRLSGPYSMKVRMYRTVKFIHGAPFSEPWRLQYIAQLTGDGRSARVYMGAPFADPHMYAKLDAPAGGGVFPSHSVWPNAYIEDDGKTHELRRFLAVVQGDTWTDPAETEAVVEKQRPVGRIAWLDWVNRLLWRITRRVAV